LVEAETFFKSRCIAEANITVQWIETDICQHESVRSAVEGSDVVIHMASVIDVYRTMTWEDVTNVNVDGDVFCFGERLC